MHTWGRVDIGVGITNSFRHVTRTNGHMSLFRARVHINHHRHVTNFTPS